MLFDYDDSNLESIYNYAKKLEGMTFREILNEYNNSIQKFYLKKNKNFGKFYRNIYSITKVK